MSWTEEFFGDYYLKIHLPLLTEDVNQEDVDFIEDILNLAKGSSILDLPCGYGRHSNLLASRGYNVTGIDYKEEFINLAKENSKEIANVNFIQDDMRKLNFENKFDAILNFFTSFGYFSDEENFDVLKRMSKALKENGKLVIDMVNREWALNMTRENGLIWLLYPDNKVFLANNKFDLFNGRWISEQIIVDKGKSHEQLQNVRVYTYTELNMMLGEVGMKITQAYGDNLKTPYAANSKNMIIVAEKI